MEVFTRVVGLAAVAGALLFIPAQAAVDPAGEELTTTCITVEGTEFCAEHPAENPPVLELQTYCRAVTDGGTRIKVCWNKPEPDEILPGEYDVAWPFCATIDGKRICRSI